MSLAPGEVFAGYIIVRLLGSGGMGEVYLAQHPRLPRQDALKILHIDVSADQDYRQRFIREADLAAKLWHPNIVRVNDRGEFNGQLWISMDFVDGTDAASLLRDRYPAGMPADEVATILTAIASALDYAHQHDLLHRDVKPANILLTNPGDGDQRILLSDFGIARRIGDISGLTATNMTVGTLPYAAPEQLMDEPIDGRTDQYALAATAYHLLTGSPLFPQTNPAAVISRHLTAPPPALADTRPGLAAFDPVLAVALAKDPADRFASCTDFACAFAEAAHSGGHATASAATMQAPLAGRPPESTAVPSALADADKRQRRRRWRTVAPLILAVLFLGAAAFAATQVLRPDAQPSTALPQWQPYVDYAKQFTIALTSLDYQDPDSGIQRIIDGSTGQFRDDFSKARSDFRQTIVNSKVTSQGSIDGAGLDSISGTTAQVLVASTSKVTNATGAEQDPRNYRLIIQVEKLGDTYKASKVEFVP